MSDRKTGETRSAMLLRLAAEYIRENCPDGEIFYDGTDCDGLCLAYDLMAAYADHYDTTASEQSMSEWQPIETAPKDGTRMLLFIPSAGEGWSTAVYICGQWDEEKYAKKPRPHWGNDRGHLFGKLWEREHQPTYWMPLPSPPQTPPERKP